MPDLPSGTVTFLFTDLEGSTKLWDQFPDLMGAALARHDQLLRDAVESHRGRVVKTMGDGILAVFQRALDGAAAAIAAQRALEAEPWEPVGLMRVRMSLHTGEAEQRGDDYFGVSLNRAARLMSCGHGGQVLCSAVTAELLTDGLPPDVKLTFLGEHALRDLVRSERVFQLTAGDLTDTFPPIAASAAVGGAIPSVATSFVGRLDDIDAIADLFDSARLVCVTGVGGVGKTRLALEVATDLQPQFRHGVWVCDLTAVSDPNNVIDVVVATLQVRAGPGVSLETAVIDFLRTRELLLLLDNCEHVMDPVTTLARDVLSSCLGVRILATSREALGLPGEHVWPLRPLATSSGRAQDPVSDAERLFEDRARSARGNFALDERNRESVAEICRRLDGIPLAVELAAARVVAMSPSEIAARLDERFRLLTGTRRRAIERHQTLRAAVSWSYSLLSQVEQSVFVRLSVFSGDFCSDAASGVVADDDIDAWDVLDSLESLTAKSMVVSEAAEDSTTRYSMLETLRQFARDELDGGTDGDEWRRRHARFYAELAERLGPRCLGPDEVESLRTVMQELDNLRAATLWSLDTPTDHDPALRITAALAGVATMNRSAGTGSWAEQALSIVGETTPGRQAAILGAAAWRLLDQGEFARARDCATRGLEHAFEADCPAPTLAPVALGLVNLSEGVGDPVAVLHESLGYLEARPDNLVHLSNLHAAIAAFSLSGSADPEVPRQEAERSLELAKESGSALALAVAISTLGHCYLAAGDAERALKNFEESITLTQKGASDVMYGPSLSAAAQASAQLGHWHASARFTRDTVEHADRTGDDRQLYGAFIEAVIILGHFDRLEAAATIDAHCEAAGLGHVSLAGHLETRDAVLARALAETPRDQHAQARERGAAMSHADATALVTAELTDLADDT